MNLPQYITNINQRYKLGNATEHTFRGDLQQLIESIVPTIKATNEPKRQSCGAPDYILTKGDIPVGFIEAKDIGDADLDGQKKSGNKEQFDRYKASLSNIIFTDYLSFHLYQDGQFKTAISIGKLTDKGIEPIPENFAAFENLLKDFTVKVSQTIKSSKRLAELMAGKARLLADVIDKALTSDEVNHQNSTLHDQMLAFKQILIHDITPKGFADVYAQTITYGMFAARLHDPTLPTFSRQEAAELIPKSNPFLRKLFGYIAGPDIDDRIKWIVDGLVEIFLACNVEDMLKGYGKNTKMEDPIIHFYEDFLSEYDPKLRKARGVWYTPQPVVDFIVRAVDDILKTEFNLPQGLADTSKTKIKVNLQATDKRFKDNIKTIEEEVHKVQILDPATGTGTFLAQVVKYIYTKFEGQQGIWSNYVEKHLLPRLNGFELLMASYAMAHLKLDLLLKETGYKPTSNQRLRVYLTNSLEEAVTERPNLFMAQWLTEEGVQADVVKRDTPVMCVIGNPPYASSSSNNSKWIQNLISDYKKNLNEKKSNINDDYIKFLRYGQYFIEKNGSGILAFITNNSFLDGITTREMRKNLLNTFDKIYVLDLHGDVKKKLSFRDENVFDIQQGVSINLFVKTSSKKVSCEFNYSELFGKRLDKYNFLQENGIKTISWEKPILNKHYAFFNSVGNNSIVNYEKGITLTEIFREYNSGIQTKNDELLVQDKKQNIEILIDDIKNQDVNYLKGRYKISEGVWTWKNAQDDVKSNRVFITEILYRPFDIRYVGITNKSGGLVGRPRYSITKHLIDKENLGLICNRQCVGEEFSFIGVSKCVTAHGTFYLGNRGQDYLLPLYLYPDNNAQQTISQQNERTPNLNPAIVKQIAEKLGLTFTNEKETTKGTFAPIDILDYIYAVLHSPKYREKYKEFLKIDFPRVPNPKNAAKFWQLVKLGKQIREIHLLESPEVENYITQYPINGDNVVTKPTYKDGKVYINQTQYFNNVPQVAWEFYIGGYQPAQKWLKDRKDRKLEFEDILHYQKIIVALTQTNNLMQQIDEVGVEE